MDQDSDQHLEALEQRLSARIEASEKRVIERMRDMQNELLKAWLPAEERGHARDAALEARVAAIETRLDIMQKRLLEIEMKLVFNSPPQPGIRSRRTA
jgi:hypothetical protein